MINRETESGAESGGRIAVGCVIANKDGKILLLHRNRENPRKVQWELPGGKFDPDLDEDLLATAIREADEELGVRVKIIGTLGTDGFFENGEYWGYIWYWASIEEGVPRPMEEGFDQVKYFSWEQIGNLEDPLSPNLLNLRRAYLQKELRLDAVA